MTDPDFDCFAPLRQDLLERMRRISQNVVAKHAPDVDTKARFPHEAFEALRADGLLGCAVPTELGGHSATLPEVAAMCTILAQSCASTAMIFAMHQIQVICIVRHGLESAWFRSYLSDCAGKQRLIASATSELGVGGDVRSSKCAVSRGETHFELEKRASVISYGEHCNDILITARRAPDAAPGDQVLALIREGDYSLAEKLSAWDTLGMRGTCSLGFLLKSRAPLEQILTVPFADISAQTMHPVSHVVWTSCWLGLGLSAVGLARKYVRAEARKQPGVLPPNALRVAELVGQLHVLRGAVRDALHEYGRRFDDPESLSELAFQIRMNNLKISASEQIVPLVAKAMSICGMSSYRNDSPYALGRHLRDAFGAGVMILNDRLYGTNARLLLVSKED